MKASGALVAEALAGSWRASPGTPALTSGQWAEVAPSLLATGAGGLGWWRLRDAGPEEGPAGRILQDAYRLHTLDARRQEERLARAIQLFTEARLRPVLAKGWAVARLYPRPGLRPYGDLDLHVDVREHRAAAALLPRCREEGLLVDLHAGFPSLSGPWRAREEHATPVAFGEMEVRVLGPEDHLNLLCDHFLSHGGWRPLWLCDVALFMERLPAGFDWGRIARSPAADRTRLVVGLAHALLGADLRETPWPLGMELPSWLPEAVLRAWGRGGHYSLTARIAHTDLEPGTLLDALRIRWPNPIEATVRWGGPLDDGPRLPFQLLDAGARAARALWDAPPLLIRRLRDRTGR